MNMTPREIEALADAIVDCLRARRASNLDPDRLIDVHEAASVLNCSVPTVERLTRNGAIKSIKVGRLRRYRRSDLMAQKPTTEEPKSDCS